MLCINGIRAVGRVLVDGTRSAAAVGNLLAKLSHRAVGVIDRQLFDAEDAEGIAPSAGIAIKATCPPRRCNRARG